MVSLRRRIGTPRAVSIAAMRGVVSMASTTPTTVSPLRAHRVAHQYVGPRTPATAHRVVFFVRRPVPAATAPRSDQVDESSQPRRPSRRWGCPSRCSAGTGGTRPRSNGVLTPCPGPAAVRGVHVGGVTREDHPPRAIRGRCQGQAGETRDRFGLALHWSLTEDLADDFLRESAPVVDRGVDHIAAGVKVSRGCDTRPRARRLHPVHRRSSPRGNSSDPDAGLSERSPW